MPVNVDRLIELFAFANRALAPGAIPFTRFWDSTEQVERLAELSVFSRTPDFWNVYCCLAGYTDGTAENPRDVLHLLPFHELLLPAVDLRPAWEESKFLSYSGPFVGIDRSFAAAAYVLDTTFGPEIRFSSLKNVDCIERCLEENRGNPQQADACIAACPDG